MPPKKEAKEKQVKGDEADQYLKSVNRPYASTDVSANLKNQVPKAAAQKILQALADKGDLTMKAYGKQTIFVYNQDSLPVPSAEELKKLEDAQKETMDVVKERREELKALEKEISAISSLPKTKDLPVEVSKLENENNLTLSALAPYRGDGTSAVQPLSDAEIRVIDNEFDKWRKEWTSRRNTYKGVSDVLLDMSDGKRDVFEDEQGINKDDDEATAIEKGEFCAPKPLGRPSKTTAKRPSPLGASTVKTTSTIATSIAPAGKKGKTVIATVTTTRTPASAMATSTASASKGKKRTATIASLSTSTTSSPVGSQQQQDSQALEVDIQGDEDQEGSEESSASPPVHKKGRK